MKPAARVSLRPDVKPGAATARACVARALDGCGKSSGRRARGFEARVTRAQPRPASKAARDPTRLSTRARARRAPPSAARACSVLGTPAARLKRGGGGQAGRRGRRDAPVFFEFELTMPATSARATARRSLRASARPVGRVARRAARSLPAGTWRAWAGAHALHARTALSRRR